MHYASRYLSILYNEPPETGSFLKIFLKLQFINQELLNPHYIPVEIHLYQDKTKNYTVTYFVQVSEDNKKVRRMTSKPLPQDSVEARQIAKGRTIYCVCIQLFTF